MALIMLTRPDGKHRYVESSQIADISPCVHQDPNRGCTVSLANGMRFDVKETSERVWCAVDRVTTK